jgi:multiple sugar transport system substrate-binding protein
MKFLIEPITTFLKKILHRRIFLLIVIYLSCQLAASCSNPFSRQEKVTLRLLVQRADDQDWKDLINEFQDRNPNISVELENRRGNLSLTTDALRDRYLEMFRDPDSSIDLVFIDTIWLPKFAKEGWLESIKPEDFPDLDENFLERWVESSTFEGKIYRIPFRTDIGVLFYRKDLLKISNNSSSIFDSRVETFEELFKLSRELQNTKKVKIGYLWQGKHYEGLSAMFLEVLKGHGGFWIEEKTNEAGLQEMQAGLDKPEAIEAINFLKRTIDEKISPKETLLYTEDETLRNFRQGKAAFLRLWPGSLDDLNNNRDSQVRGKVGIQLMVHANNQKGQATIGGWGLGVAKKSKHKAEAIKAIQFFTSAEMQRRSALELGILPTRKNLFYDPEIVNKHEFFPDLKKIIDENSVFRPRIVNYSEASAILQDCLTQVLKKGGMDVQKAMKRADADTEYLLKQGKRRFKTSCNYMNQKD